MEDEVCNLPTIVDGNAVPKKDLAVELPKLMEPHYMLKKRIVQADKYADNVRKIVDDNALLIDRVQKVVHEKELQNKKLNDKQIEIENLQKELVEKDIRIRSLEETNNKKNEEVIKLQKKVKDISSNFQEKNIKSTKLKKELLEKDLLLENVKMENLNLNTKIVELQAKIESLSQNLADVNTANTNEESGNLNLIDDLLMSSDDETENNHDDFDEASEVLNVENDNTRDVLDEENENSNHALDEESQDSPGFISSMTNTSIFECLRCAELEDEIVYLKAKQSFSKYRLISPIPEENRKTFRTVSVQTEILQKIVTEVSIQVDIPKKSKNFININEKAMANNETNEETSNGRTKLEFDDNFVNTFTIRSILHRNRDKLLLIINSVSYKYTNNFNSVDMNSPNALPEIMKMMFKLLYDVVESVQNCFENTLKQIDKTSSKDSKVSEKNKLQRSDCEKIRNNDTNKFNSLNNKTVHTNYNNLFEYDNSDEVFRTSRKRKIVNVEEEEVSSNSMKVFNNVNDHCDSLLIKSNVLNSQADSRISKKKFKSVLPIITEVPSEIHVMETEFLDENTVVNQNIAHVKENQLSIKSKVRSSASDSRISKDMSSQHNSDCNNSNDFENLTSIVENTLDNTEKSSSIIDALDNTEKNLSPKQTKIIDSFSPQKKALLTSLCLKAKHVKQITETVYKKPLKRITPITRKYVNVEKILPVLPETEAGCKFVKAPKKRKAHTPNTNIKNKLENTSNIEVANLNDSSKSLPNVKGNKNIKTIENKLARSESVPIHNQNSNNKSINLPNTNETVINYPTGNSSNEVVSAFNNSVSTIKSISDIGFNDETSNCSSSVSSQEIVNINSMILDNNIANVKNTLNNDGINSIDENEFFNLTNDSIVSEIDINMESINNVQGMAACSYAPELNKHDQMNEIVSKSYNGVAVMKNISESLSHNGKFDHNVERCVNSQDSIPSPTYTFSEENISATNIKIDKNFNKTFYPEIINKNTIDESTNNIMNQEQNTNTHIKFYMAEREDFILSDEDTLDETPEKYIDIAKSSDIQKCFNNASNCKVILHDLNKRNVEKVQRNTIPSLSVPSNSEPIASSIISEYLLTNSEVAQKDHKINENDCVYVLSELLKKYADSTKWESLLKQFPRSATVFKGNSVKKIKAIILDYLNSDDLPTTIGKLQQLNIPNLTVMLTDCLLNNLHGSWGAIKQYHQKSNVVSKLVSLIHHLGQIYDGFFDHTMKSICYKIFRFKPSPQDDLKLFYSQIYIALCVKYNNTKALSLFMIDTVYCLHLKAVSVMQQLLTACPSLIQVYQPGVRENLVHTTIKYLILQLKPLNGKSCMSDRMRQTHYMIKQIYRLPADTTTCDELLEKIMQRAKYSPDIDVFISSVLLARRELPAWVMNKLVNQNYFPLLQNSWSEYTDSMELLASDKTNHNLIRTIDLVYRIIKLSLNVLGAVGRTFSVDNKDKVNSIICFINEMLNSKFSTQSIQESVVSTMIQLSRHQYDTVLDFMMLWTPNFVPSLPLVNKIKRFIAKQPLRYWENKLSNEYELKERTESEKNDVSS